MDNQELKYKYREEWLEHAVEALRPLFVEKGLFIPESVKVSCGWPKVEGSITVLGTCYHAECSKENLREIFITPIKGHNDLYTPEGVIAITIHELCHSCFEPEEKHGPNFAKAAKDMGLAGKLRSTHITDEMIIKVQPLIDPLGLYPQPGMIPAPKQSKPRIVRTKTLKCECGYEIKVHEDHLAKGKPNCPVCKEDFAVIN